MEYIITWFIFCILVGCYAGSKGRSGIGFFFLSFFLSPLIGFLFALIAKRNEQKGQTKKCPFCAEFIKIDAVVCRFCKRDLPPKEEEPILSKKEESEEEPCGCGYCFNNLRAGAKRCWNCKRVFTNKEIVMKRLTERST